MDVAENPVLGQTPPESSPAAAPSFWEEFQEYWGKVPDKGLFLGLLAGWCVLFEVAGISSFNFGVTRPSLFEWMYRAWNEPAMDSSQGNLIPFVVAILLWIRRKALAASIKGVWLPGLVVVGAALALHVLGYLAQQQRLSVIALFLGLYGLVGTVWGWRTMQVSFFPLVLFAFCMPLGTFAEDLTLPLRLMSAKATWLICHGVLGIGVVQKGTMLWDEGGHPYEVAAACSGIHSFVALLAVTTVFSMLIYRTVWRRGVVLALTLPLVVVCNVFRLVVVILTSTAFGLKAGLWVHEWFGFVTYLLAIVLLFLVAHWLREKQPAKEA